MTTKGLPPQRSQGTGMTLDYVIQTLQNELRQGMEQQQQRLSEETLGTIEEGLAPVHELIEKVENKITKGIQATLANAQGLSKGQEELERSIGHMTTGTAILRSRVCAIEEKIAELERHDLGLTGEYDIHKRRAEMPEMHPRSATGEKPSHTYAVTKQRPAQPVSPGPWGPQDEEFEQEAWSSILGYVPGIPHQEKPPRKNKNPGEQAEDARKTTAVEQAAGPPPAAQPPPLKATRGVLRGLSPLAAGAARAIPEAKHVPVKPGDGVYYQKAAPRGSEHAAQQTHDHTEPTKTIRDNHNNSDDYLHAPGLVLETQPPPALLVPPGGPTPLHRGLHPDQDAFEDASPTDEARDQRQEARGDPPGAAKEDAEEPDWSRDSQDEADEGKDDDIANYDMPGPSHGTRGSERPAEPDGAPPSRPAINHGSGEALSAEEMRTERNRRARAEWREWRRQQRRRGLAPGYFYPSGAEQWKRRT
ncbi:unnamed protein product [Symbiodinium microadriaticum]|nr:unnamed protein product [Symbiodinium sp. KB8]CAE7881188.1 unnamed protein product [Symbiodinium microadriaticum]